MKGPVDVAVNAAFSHMRVLCGSGAKQASVPSSSAHHWAWDRLANSVASCSLSSGHFAGSLAFSISNCRQCADNGDVIDVVACAVGQWAVLAPSGHAAVDQPRISTSLAVSGQTYSVRALGPKHRSNPTQRLADAALVFYQRKTDVVVAVLTKTNPGRDRNLGFCHQLFGELQ